MVDGNDKLYNMKLWKKEFYNFSRDCIIPVHNIFGQFVEGSFLIDQKQPHKYMSVISLNRKFHV